MKAIEAAYLILEQSGEQLHYVELTKRILGQGLWVTEGKTPQETINARLAVDIKEKGSLSKFQRTAPSTYALRSLGLEEYISSRTAIGKNISTKTKSVRLTFNDAAELVLENIAEHKPMHYREISEKILELDLVDTQGQTPEATLYAQILTEIKRETKKKKKPRFVKYGHGMVGLRKWMGEGLAYQIEQHNQEIRDSLLIRLIKMDPYQFENLIGELLAEMGFENIEVTKAGGDKGVDVRGVLVVGEAIRTNMAVQVKRWKTGNNVQSPDVQKVRGSLGAHEQGLIITTSNFSPGARKEAERPDAIPVGLMNGEELVELMIEHGVGVQTTSYPLHQLGQDE